MMLFLIDHAYDEAGEIVFAIGIEAGHFGGFAADQRASVVLAGVGDAFNHLFGDLPVRACRWRGSP